MSVMHAVTISSAFWGRFNFNLPNVKNVIATHVVETQDLNTLKTLYYQLGEQSADKFSIHGKQYAIDLLNGAKKSMNPLNAHAYLEGEHAITRKLATTLLDAFEKGYRSKFASVVALAAGALVAMKLVRPNVPAQWVDEQNV